ncbi:MAG: aldo/keto reductase [Defluviitaleaceae bacterium]|nr:aldo/keto reductase [Defluviitaleaceae bacterium]
MKFFELNNGVKMPMLGMGVSQIAPDVDGVQVVLDLLKAGYRAIDTAEFYGNEDMVGKGISQSGIDRSEIFVTTKVHNAAQASEDGVLNAFEQSLKKLGLDYIDLYLMHWPMPDRFLHTWKILEKIYKSGKARAIGVCNFKIHHLQELATIWEIPPAVNQYEHHPYLTQPSIREYCQNQNILVTAYCPLGRGRLGLLDEPAIKEIAVKHNKTAAQIILRWNMELGVAAIPKTVTPSRMAENFDIFDFALNTSDIDAINSLDKGIRVIRDPDDPNSY